MYQWSKSQTGLNFSVFSNFLLRTLTGRLKILKLDLHHRQTIFNHLISQHTSTPRLQKTVMKVNLPKITTDLNLTKIYLTSRLKITVYLHYHWP